MPSATTATPAARTASGRSPCNATPSSSIRPDTIAKAPAIAITSVDLPAPLAPTSAVI